MDPRATQILEVFEGNLRLTVINNSEKTDTSWRIGNWNL